MQSIPPYIYLIAAFIAWIGLIVSWQSYMREVTESRRVEAMAHGETPPDIKGTSNYERAALREHAHRASKVTPRERLIGRGLFLGVPAIIVTVFFTSTYL